MNSGRTVFSQLIDFLPAHQFHKSVARYHGGWHVRSFTCWDQFLCLSFAQLTYRESLRDIVTCLRAMGSKLYHAGIRSHVSHSTLADANEKRDWRIYADFAAILIARARELYRDESFGIELKQTVYVFDSTTIDLCLSLFPWAQFRRHKSAVKLHTLIDLRGNIPCFIRITSGRVVDVSTLSAVPIEPGSFYIMDRGYIDFARLYAFHQGAAYFVIRAKKALDYARRCSVEVDKTTGVRADQKIVLCGPKTARLYPELLRRVSYRAEDPGTHFVFLTNNFMLPALTIANLYKCRWQVELFFKWIKQYLRIKAFYGTSPNAVKTQIWTAICVYVLVAIVKKELRIEGNLGEILQILSISLFEKVPLSQVLTRQTVQNEMCDPCNQLTLFD